MLPSKGLFSSYHCPFFEQGSCERSYCHFHHRKKTKPSEIRRYLKTSHSIQEEHTNALEENRKGGNNLDKIYKRAECSSLINDTGILTYTPTPIAILKKRNTTGCDNHKLERDEEMIIKKQKTSSNKLGSSKGTEYSTENVFKTKNETISSTSIEEQLIALHYKEDLNESSNNIDMSKNKIHCLATKDKSLNSNEKICKELNNTFQFPTNSNKSEKVTNLSMNRSQTILNLAVEKSGTPKTNTSNLECYLMETNIPGSDTTKSSAPRIQGESLMCNNFEEIRSNGYIDCAEDVNYDNGNKYNDENEDPSLKSAFNYDNTCITSNETCSNYMESSQTPRETYANIVKHDKNFSYRIENISKYSTDSLSKVGNNFILNEEIDNHKANRVSDIARKNNTKPNNEGSSYIEDDNLLNIKYTTASKALLSSGKLNNRSVLNEVKSGIGTNETLSSIIRSINVKERISHTNSTETKTSILSSTKVKPHFSPSQVLLDRWKTSNTLNKKSNGNKEIASKTRIAHVPNVAALLAERQRITNSLIKPCQIKDSDLNSSKQYEGVSPLKKDLLVESFHNGKIPFIKRQTFLNKAFEIYCKLYSCDSARSKALHTEKEICSTSKTPATYSNKFAQLFIRLKKEIAAKNNLQKTSTKNANSQKSDDEANRLLLYKDLLKYTLHDLEENGIPVPHPEKSGFAKMKKIYGVSSFNKHRCICINCSKEFEVDSAGFSVERNCKFHSGRMYKQRRKYGTEKMWNCCNGDEESGGCVQNELHVGDMVDYDNIPGFKQVRKPADSTFKEACQVYALDCEMCYTTQGSELTRCTVVDGNLTVVYDKLCVPDHPIIDYCTRFSGISEGDLDNVATRLTDIQADLLNLFTTETILIGHGIGNDLKAVKLLHRSIIDTNVVYGNFRKHKLSDLTRAILHREIQMSEGGHNSCEDAIATMELMLFKVKEDRKASMPTSRTDSNVGLNGQKLLKNTEKSQKKE
ncbi:uncharacterized protein LOC111064383 [Nilaparvata lugens]|uniref:uncharacterized protein LOC111064383 n=1 Tax=Nilaparvata lugens TaxID=108931 RepID=UPI00193E4828|nr:uncharacterized protein LOC111064383 [Nilaparvata lugens]